MDEPSELNYQGTHELLKLPLRQVWQQRALVTILRPLPLARVLVQARKTKSD